MTADLDPFKLARTQTTDAPGAAPVRPSLAELHRRWAVSETEASGLRFGVDSIMMGQAGRAWPFVTMEEGCVFDDAQIDGVIDQRSAQSPSQRARNEQQRIAYKAALAARAIG